MTADGDPSRVVHDARLALKELEESGKGFEGGELGDAAYLRRFLAPFNTFPDSDTKVTDY
jgi:hypothetical protein